MAMLGHISDAFHESYNADPAINTMGCVPIVGSVIGVCRIAYSITKAVFLPFYLLGNIALVYSTKEYFADVGKYVQSTIGHAFRGLFETISIAGYILSTYDKIMQSRHSHSQHRYSHIYNTIRNEI